MKQILLLIICFMAIITTQSCSYKETVKISENHAYISFEGNLQGAVAIIDDKVEFDLSPYAEEKKDVRYELSPGRHQIKVKRNGQIVVNRDLLFSNEIVTEINVP